jgi:hypothetical protein
MPSNDKTYYSSVPPKKMKVKISKWPKNAIFNKGIYPLWISCSLKTNKTVFLSTGFFPNKFKFSELQRFTVLYFLDIFYILFSIILFGIISSNCKGDFLNPFKYGQIVTSNDYCHRNELEKLLKSRILSSQNTYIEGERRTGKTSLIKEVVGKLKKKKLVYIDFYEIRTVEDVLNRLVNGMANVSAGFFQELIKATSALRPIISMDPLTNMPSVSITGSSPSERPNSIIGILDLLSNREFKNVIIVFDEFQDIIKTADSSQILAIMRSKIQFLTSLPFLFCGSSRSDIHKIFTHHDSPFFKSALPLDVGNIERPVFCDFLLKKFQSAKLNASIALINRVLDISLDNPGDTQQLCWALADISKPNTEITEESIMIALRHIFSTEKKGYESCLPRITAIQLKCLRAIAKIGGRNTASKKFIWASGVANTSTIKKSLLRLEELKILFQRNNEYKFINPFFAQWLVHMNY